jgi:hypothetical protein
MIDKVNLNDSKITSYIDTVFTLQITLYDRLARAKFCCVHYYIYCVIIWQIHIACDVLYNTNAITSQSACDHHKTIDEEHQIED